MKCGKAPLDQNLEREEAANILASNYKEFFYQRSLELKGPTYKILPVTNLSPIFCDLREFFILRNKPIETAKYRHWSL